MAKKFDLEDLLESIKALMTEGDALNNKIAAIDLEKTDAGKALATPLKPVPANGYYEQSWSDKILQTSPAIFYGVEDIQPVLGANTIAKTYVIFCEVIYTDNGQTNDAYKRIQRYTRALEELFSETFDALASKGTGTVKIQTVRPQAFKLEMNSSEEIKVGGVSLTITLY